MRIRTVCIGLFIASAAGAANGATTAYSLAECRRVALERNLALRSNRLALQVDEASILREIGTRYDPIFTMQANTNAQTYPNELVQTINPADSTVTYVAKTVPKRTAYSFGIGLSKAFAYGTTLSLAAANPWSLQAGKQSVNSSLQLSARQPILRGFGRTVTESSIAYARMGQAETTLELRAAAESTIRDVETAYWDLVSATEALAVARLSEQGSTRLLDQARTLARQGAKAERDILDAEHELSVARQDIIAKETAVRNAEDRLRAVMNLPDDAPGIALVDTPAVVEALAPEDSLVAMALRNRADVRAREIGIERSALAADLARDRLRPKLDASADLSFSDGDRTFGRSIDDLGRGGGRSWAAGLSFSLPVRGRAAQSDYRSALLGQEQAELAIEARHHEVRTDVRIAVRDVATTRERIAAARETVRLGSVRLANEQERLRLGLATTYDVIKYERDLAVDRLALLDARIGHQRAILALEEATGTLLGARNVRAE